jgi:hypothetical protein
MKKIGGRRSRANILLKSGIPIPTQKMQEQYRFTKKRSKSLHPTVQRQIKKTQNHTSYFMNSTHPQILNNCLECTSRQITEIRICTIWRQKKTLQNGNIKEKSSRGFLTCFVIAPNKFLLVFDSNATRVFLLGSLN